MPGVLEPKADWSVQVGYQLEVAVKASSSYFFILVFIMSVPFYIFGASGTQLPGMAYLPASALMGFVPALASLILVHRQRGDKSALAFLKSIFQYGTNRGASWIRLTLFFMPLVCVVEFGVLKLTQSPLPVPQTSYGEPIFHFAAILIGAIVEELGWQGFPHPRLINSHTVFGSALILGIIWAL
jgi:membrane protease YdiL (CAAX protease family)